MKEELSILQNITNYYIESEQAYHNWGRDEKRDGIYALHCGFARKEHSLTHLEEVKQLSRELIHFGKLQPNSLVLDAGCGAGALSFEIASQHPGVQVIGINIAQNQLSAANNFRLTNRIDGVNFCKQDYHNMAFLPNTFDTVFFCESYVHSWDKTQLIREVFRVLKPGGKIVLSDVFLKRRAETKEEEAILEDIKSGWCLPSLLSISELNGILIDCWFSDIFFKNCTENTLKSTREMRQHTEQQIKNGDIRSNILELSRKAVIAGNKSFERGLAGYYFMCSIKP